MKKSWTQQIALLVFILFLSFGVIFLLNLPNVTSLLTTIDTEINPGDEYKLENLIDIDLVSITATSDPLFIAKSDSYTAFSTKEYKYDFILFSEEEFKDDEQTHLCTNITKTEDALLNNLIEKFNKPIELNNNDLSVNSEEVINAITEQTKGQFGDLTLLLDCRDQNIIKDEKGVYSVIFLETIIVFTALIVLFNNKLLFISRHINDKH